MATLTRFYPQSSITDTPLLPKILDYLCDPAEIQAFLKARGIRYEHWPVQELPVGQLTEPDILTCMKPWLQPYMADHGYQSADVIHITPDMKNLQTLRDKFIAEHTHSEDEVRFFIEGRGHFWYHLNQGDYAGEIFCIIAEAGDLISVPAGTTHWFELDPDPFVTVIRLFSDSSGWIAQYTDSEHEQPYLGQTLRTSFARIHTILMDVEGTTTDLHFVHQVLFPYSQENLPPFLREQAHSQTFLPQVFEALIAVATTLQAEGTCLDLLKPLTHKDPLPPSPQMVEILINTLLGWIASDRKHPALKTLQGLLWRQGYEQESFYGHVYPDVPVMFQKWQNTGLQLAIYSSGSVLAQQLLFRHSAVGDLTPYLTRHFDTVIGSKQDSLSYQRIAQQLEQPANGILFLSDVLAELQAAKTVGLKVAQLVRSNTPTARFTHSGISRIPSFYALDVLPILSPASCGR